VALLAPGAARAVEVGMQDDSVMVYTTQSRSLALQQFIAAGGQWVRINVYHAPRDEPGSGVYALDTHAGLDRYDEAVDAIRAAGLNVQMTLTWYGENDADAVAEWAGQVSQHFAGHGVNRFSLLNEPDLTLVGAADLCDPETIRRLGSTLSKSYTVDRLVRVPNRQVRRIRVHGHTRWVRKGTRRPYLIRRIVVRNHKRHVRFYRRSTKAGTKLWSTEDGQLVTARQGCLAIMRGRMYKAIASAATKAIRANAPGTQVLAGETSPAPTAEAFAREVGHLPIDGWAHHPYDFSAGCVITMDQIDELRDVVGVPIYATEYGEMWGTPNRATTLARNIQTGIAHGVVEIVQYGWFSRQPNWDTALMRSDDGSLTPEYDAFRAAVS
jgi:hypothetical protein